MINIIAEIIKNSVDPRACLSAAAYQQFLAKIAQGKFTRDEGSPDHFCVTFFPYNPDTKQVFLTHHKKSGLWIAPGGHVDRGELPLATLRRELREELGFDCAPPQELKPFLFTIITIPSTQLGSCSHHYELWYKIPTDGSIFQIDPREFYATRWATIDEARRLVTDKDALFAIDKIAAEF